MKIKAINKQLALLLVAAAFAAATANCQRTQPSEVNEWSVFLSDRVQTAGLELRLDGTPVQLPQHLPPGKGENEVIAQRPASQKLRVELLKQGKPMLDFTADRSHGNAVRLFPDATKGVGVSQCPFRNVTVRTRSPGEMAADLLLHRDDSKSGATVCMNIPEAGWLFLKVPTNQPNGVLRIGLAGKPTVLLTQIFVD